MKRKIKLNGQAVEVESPSLTYEQIAALSYQPTVVYSRGPKSKPDGTLCQGQKVRVREGMIINCVQTGSA